MKTILIIDDEAPIRKMLRQLFEKNGFSVLDAADGNQGIEIYKTDKPDLLITDLIMPGKEGLETIREIKRLNPNVKIIAISGGGISDPGLYLDFATKFGAQLAFAKPIQNDELLKAVDKLLSE